MPQFRLAVAAAALVAAAAPARVAGAQPTTITFDAVPAAGAGAFLTASGYTFANFATLEANSAFGTGSNAVGGSGRFAYVTLQPGDPDAAFGSVRRADVNFDLLDAFLSFRRFDAETAPVAITVLGYRGFDLEAAPVFTQTVLLTNSAQRVTFNFRNVSEVEFLTGPLQTGRQAVLAVDNLSVAVVPEPATAALVGVGAAVLVGAAWRRRGGGAAL
jgi:hypothetical protein